MNSKHGFLFFALVINPFNAHQPKPQLIFEVYFA